MRPYEWLLYLISNIVPRRMSRHMAKMLLWSGTHEEPRQWMGSVITFSSLCALVNFLGLWVVYEVTDPAVLLGTSLLAATVVMFIFYSLLYIRVEDRSRRVEYALPDMLQMVAANMRAGVTPIVALRMAARPEFGPLEEEIKYATTKALGVESFTDALAGIGETINSEVLERTISLFTTSLRSGGNISALLELVAEEIRSAQELRRELIASTNMYIVFILFTMIIGMPLLLSISIQFVTMVEDLQSKQGTQSILSHELGLSISPPISASFIGQASYVLLILTAVLASMLVGTIHDGSKWYGLRFAPLFITASLIVFVLLREYILSTLLGVLS